MCLNYYSKCGQITKFSGSHCKRKILFNFNISKLISFLVFKSLIEQKGNIKCVPIKGLIKIFMLPLIEFSNLSISILSAFPKEEIDEKSKLMSKIMESSLKTWWYKLTVAIYFNVSRLFLQSISQRYNQFYFCTVSHHWLNKLAHKSYKIRARAILF